MPINQNANENYLTGEVPEIYVGENPAWAKYFLKAFPALRHRNYKLYFSGQLISLIGTWLQVVAQGWLVLQLTNSAFLIGLVAAVSLLPTLFLSLFGGVIVDHFPKKQILLFTQTAAMILAFILGILTVLGVIDVNKILILAFLLGVVNALDSPARQAYVTELVPKESLASAIALNSGTFNAARVLGPGFAGILIALLGTGGAFILNAVSYIAVIIALIYIKTPAIIQNQHLKPLQAIKDGLEFSFKHPVIRAAIIFTLVMSVFGWSYATIMPVIAQNIFHTGAAGLGYLYAASGLGALIATFLASAYSQKIKKIYFIFGGTAIFCLNLILFTLTKNFSLGLIFLFISGFGLLAMTSVLATIIQTEVKDEFRGRVMSLYSLVFLGFSPIGNLEVGFLAQHFGPAIAIQFGAIIILLVTMFGYTQINKIRKNHKIYNQA